MKALLIPITFALTAAPSLAQQGSDSCTTPTTIAGQGSFPYDNTLASTGAEGQTEAACYQFGSSAIDNDVWFAWTSDFTGNAAITTCGGTSDDSKISAYPGSSCPTPGSAIACNDDVCALQSGIIIPVNAGSTYMLQVGNFPGATANTAGTLTIFEDAPAFNPANGHFYDFVQGAIDFDSARAAAESMTYLGVQGHLATVSDASENAFLASTFGGRAWIGLYQDFSDPNYTEPSGGWTWVTGEPFTYNSWNPGEPNDSSGQEHYAEMFGNGDWNDQPVGGNGVVQGFYVEFSGVTIPGTFCEGTEANPTGCPCGNPGNDGEGCANGTGVGGKLRSTGAASVSSSELVLEGSQLIPNQPALYFQGNNAVNNGDGILFGDGLRCAGGGVVRLQVRFSDSTGSSSTTVDIATKGGVAAGDVKRYQIWYRDPVTSPCGALFNLSNGLELTFNA